jgi:acyl-CoA thioesterase FadM
MVLTKKLEVTYLKAVPTQADLFVISLITRVDEKSVAAFSTILNTAGVRLAEEREIFHGRPLPHSQG